MGGAGSPLRAAPQPGRPRRAARARASGPKEATRAPCPEYTAPPAPAAAIAAAREPPPPPPPPRTKWTRRVPHPVLIGHAASLTPPAAAAAATRDRAGPCVVAHLLLSAVNRDLLGRRPALPPHTGPPQLRCTGPPQLRCSARRPRVVARVTPPPPPPLPLVLSGHAASLTPY